MSDSTMTELDNSNLSEQKNRTSLSHRKSVYQTTVGDEEPVADAIQTAVAAVSREQEEPPPLSDYIDIDRLEALIDSFPADESGAVKFSYAHYRVEIQWSGELTLWPRTGD